MHLSFRHPLCEDVDIPRLSASERPLFHLASLFHGGYAHNQIRVVTLVLSFVEERTLVTVRPDVNA